jgi:anti-sigma factor RsiW
MNEQDYCGNGEALVAYLYDECDPADREGIAAHVANCAACTTEVESLRLTRTRLAAWTPPAAMLGFRITPEQASGVEDATSPAVILTSRRWWSQPLPAWAQAAAAVLIFASGLAVGTSRSRGVEDSGARVVAERTASRPVSQQDLEALRSEIARVRTAVDAPAAPEGGNTSNVPSLVDQRVAATEARLREEFDGRIRQLVSDFQAVRTQDLMRVGNSMAGLQQVTGATLAEHGEAISQWNQVFRAQAGQVVPTNFVR